MCVRARSCVCIRSLVKRFHSVIVKKTNYFNAAYCNVVIRIILYNRKRVRHFFLFYFSLFYNLLNFCTFQTCTTGNLVVVYLQTNLHFSNMNALWFSRIHFVFCIPINFIKYNDVRWTSIILNILFNNYLDICVVRFIHIVDLGVYCCLYFLTYLLIGGKIV